MHTHTHTHAHAHVHKYAYTYTYTYTFSHPISCIYTHALFLSLFLSPTPAKTHKRTLQRRPADSIARAPQKASSQTNAGHKTKAPPIPTAFRNHLPSTHRGHLHSLGEEHLTVLAIHLQLQPVSILSIYTCLYVGLDVCISTYICTVVYEYIYIYAHTNAHSQTRTHTHIPPASTLVRTHKHTYKHTHTLTQTLSLTHTHTRAL